MGVSLSKFFTFVVVHQSCNAIKVKLAGDLEKADINKFTLMGKDLIDLNTLQDGPMQLSKSTMKDQSGEAYFNSETGMFSNMKQRAKQIYIDFKKDVENHSVSTRTYKGCIFSLSHNVHVGKEYSAALIETIDEFSGGTKTKAYTIAIQHTGSDDQYDLKPEQSYFLDAHVDGKADANLNFKNFLKDHLGTQPVPVDTNIGTTSMCQDLFHDDVMALMEKGEATSS